MVKFSNYVVAEKLSEDKVLLLSTISGSMIALDAKKYSALHDADLSFFSSEEIETLKCMAFLTEENELEQILSNRRNVIETSDSKSLKLTILTTSYCNANCYYCFEKENTRCEKSHMSFSVADDVVD